uniref:Mitochondrial inner membrane protease subunit 2 n=1 Tax=Otus sunia TaxID=257818 RepID=A0A8C8AHU5_9STRI
MAQAQGLGKRYIKAFFKGFFVAVPVTVTFLDRVACVARVEGASMQPSLNPGGRQASDVVLLNQWSIRNYDVQRGDIVSLVLLYLCVLFIRIKIKLIQSTTLCSAETASRNSIFVILPLPLQASFTHQQVKV